MTINDEKCSSCNIVASHIVTIGLKLKMRDWLTQCRWSIHYGIKQVLSWRNNVEIKVKIIYSKNISIKVDGRETLEYQSVRLKQ